MSIALAAEPPPLTTDEHGRIRIAGTRVFLEIVVADYRRGLTAEQIADEYDTITLADVYGALRYYLTHRNEVDEYIARQDAAAAELRAKIESNQKPIPTRAELLSRKTFRTGDRIPASGIWRCRSEAGVVIALSSGETFPPNPTGQTPVEWGYVSPTAR